MTARPLSMASRRQRRRALGYVPVDNERKVSPEMQGEAISRLSAAKGLDLVHT